MADILMAYILAIDQGTTSTRAILFNAKGEVVQQQQIPLRTHFPHNGWVEQDPEEIWQATLNVCRNALVAIGLQARNLVSIGVTNQRETTVIWNRQTGKAIYNAIVWQDRRTAAECQKLIHKESIIQAKTGLLVDPYFSASKIAWILNNVSQARIEAERGNLAFGTIDCFLLWRLTAGKIHATDATNASRTALFNIHTQQWDDELLHLFEIPKSILPEVKDNCADFGVTAPELFDGAIPIAAMAGDQQAALIGQACIQAGTIKSTYGTGAFLLFNTGTKAVTSKQRLLTTIAYRLKTKPTYALEGSIFSAGSIMQWLRDQLRLIINTADSAAVAASIPDNGGVYLVPAFTGLGAPYWDANARGAILGLTRNSNTAHIIRAGLEAVVYQTRDLIQAMIQDSEVNPNNLKIDGGMANNDWLAQFLADILRINIERPKIVETTAFGVAFLAGLQRGVYQSLDEITKLRQIDRCFSPKLQENIKQVWCEGWRQAVQRIVGAQHAASVF